MSLTPSEIGFSRGELADARPTDHHTRVVTGGSALPPDSTVCGLLYGYYADPSIGERRGVSVVDSEEMEYPGAAAAGAMAGDGGAHAAILQRVGLHQTIFPKHKVSERHGTP